MQQTDKGWLLTRAEFAQAFNITVKTVDDNIASGMPIAIKGKGGRGNPSFINLADARNWMLGKAERSNSQARQEAKSELDAIRLERARLELAEKRGDLIHMSDWQTIVEEDYVNTRNELARVSTEIREEYSDVPRIAQIAKSVHQKIGDALRRLNQNLRDAPQRAKESE